MRPEGGSCTVIPLHYKSYVYISRSQSDQLVLSKYIHMNMTQGIHVHEQTNSTTAVQLEWGSLVVIGTTTDKDIKKHGPLDTD